MKKAALLVLSLLLVASAPTSTLPDPQSLAAEFPPQDYAILSLERRGFGANLAARRIAEDATGVEALRALARAQDFDRAFTALRAIVDRQPRRIPDAFEAMGDALWRFRGNDEKAVRRTAELKQIVADARKILPTLPREAVGTAAGAKALYYEGTEWHGGNTPGSLGRRGSAARIPLRRGGAAAKELESG